MGGLCFGLWLLPGTPAYVALAQKAGGWLAGVDSAWNTANALLGTAAIVVKQLGTGVLVGCVAAFGLAWAACFGLGSACVRLAWARR